MDMFQMMKIKVKVVTSMSTYQMMKGQILAITTTVPIQMIVNNMALTLRVTQTMNLRLTILMIIVNMSHGMGTRSKLDNMIGGLPNMGNDIRLD